VPILGGLLDTWFMKPAWEKITENSLQNLKELIE
jgi:hypothetical protein